MLPAPTSTFLEESSVHELIDGARHGNSASQEQLYRYCYGHLIGICYRYAKDSDEAGILFNDAMLRLFRHVKKYREQGSFLAWARTILINVCLDSIRKKGWVHNTLEPISEYPDLLQPDILSSISVKEIRLLINRLPPGTAAVFNLFVYEGLTHREIGDALGIAEGSSKWHVSEGRRQLQKLVLQHFQSSDQS